ncbi:MAG TPA: arginine--tRNA ligase [Actinomycetota bacterium]|nr:arginine--tRNA ligase [Actinomycetota bacterium]
MVTDRLAALVGAALEKVAAEGGLGTADLPQPSFERPRNREHGDWATNIALVASKGGGKPRDIAQAIVAALEPSDLVERVEVAGPGFLNFRLSRTWLHDVVRRAASGSRFGRSDEGSGSAVNVEYVSANPTGPINVVSGRHAAVGDTISALLEATGHRVTREYYFNDAGRQMLLFGASVAARYLQHFGLDAAVPEDGYKGEDVTRVAEAIATEIGDELVAADPEERDQRMLELAWPRVLARAKASLERFGSRFDVWFQESTLHEKGEVGAAIDRVREKGLIEERDGALWFLSTRFGDDKDRVVIRSNGEPTYFAADLGYLVDKFGRGFDRLIYLWGADHHGTVPRLMAAVDALGFDRSSVEIPLMQIVTLTREGEAVKASKRQGVYVALDELVDEVGVDAARYTFLTRSIDAPLEFNIDLVKEQAPENPVYYVQYAHARISSILRRAEEEGYELSFDDGPLGRLMHPSEDELMRKLASYEEVVPEAARLRAPQRITRYVEELASTFSSFYRDCKVITEDRELTAGRLALALATRAVVADGLGLLGVSAPERM